MKRIILEMGTGNDLYGGDYTKAACRAVQDALHHSSITLFQTLGYRHEDMSVRVTIGVADPDAVDTNVVAATLPRGVAQVRAIKGGLNVENDAGDTPHVIATAAVEAYLDVDQADWKLSGT